MRSMSMSMGWCRCYHRPLCLAPVWVLVWVLVWVWVWVWELELGQQMVACWVAWQVLVMRGCLGWSLDATAGGVAL